MIERLQEQAERCAEAVETLSKHCYDLAVSGESLDPMEHFGPESLFGKLLMECCELHTELVQAREAIDRHMGHRPDWERN